MPKKQWSSRQTEEMFRQFRRYEEDESTGWKPCLNKQTENRQYIESKHEELVEMSNEGIEHAFRLDSGTVVPQAVFVHHYVQKSKAQESDERAEILAQTHRKPGNQDQLGDDECPTEVQEDLSGHLVRDDEDDVIVVPVIIGSYKTSLASGKTMRKAHLMIETPSGWQPAYGREHWFAIKQQGKCLEINVSFTDDRDKDEDADIFNAEELLINDALCEHVRDNAGSPINMYTYGNLIGGTKHPAVIAFEEEIERRPCKGAVIKVPLPFACSTVCEVEGSNSGRNQPLVRLCDSYFPL